MTRMPVNEDFFKVWNPKMAYVLGFFCADGVMTINPRGSKYIEFNITDAGLLLEINQSLGAHQTITRRSYNKGKDTYRLQIGSKELFTDLLAMGLTPKKTFRFEMPPVPAPLFSHFVRGYFDGDGNVWSGLLHKERKTPLLTLRTLFTSGNEKFLIQLSEYLENHLSIKGYFGYSSGAHRLVYAAKSSLFLYRFMYTDMANNLFLDRKKKVFEKYVANAAVV